MHPKKVLRLIQRIVLRQEDKKQRDTLENSEEQDNSSTDAALFLSIQGEIIGIVHMNNPHELKKLDERVRLSDLIPKEEQRQFNEYVNKLRDIRSCNDFFFFKMSEVYDHNKYGVITPLKDNDEELIAFLLFIMDKESVQQLTDDKVFSFVQTINDEQMFFIQKTSSRAEKTYEYVSSRLRHVLHELNPQCDGVTECFLQITFEKNRKRLQERYDLLRFNDYLDHQFPIKGHKQQKEWIHERVIVCKGESEKISFRFYQLNSEGEDEVVHHLTPFMLHPVTKLPETDALYKKIDELIVDEAKDPFALLYLNIENFHWIDDYLGNNVSKTVIREIVSRIQATVAEDVFIAQLKKDSFALIIEDYGTKQSIYHISEQLIKKICEKLVVDDYEFYVSSTVGISFYPESGDNKYKLLENAHTALYQAKQLGKNNYEPYTSDRQDIATYKRIVLEQDLLEAIEAGDIEMFYQPKIDPLNNRIVGAEALLRWNHKDWGMITPGEFIPLAEKANVMHELEDWVIENVCQQIRTWKRKLDHVCPISINISPTRLMKRGIDEYFAEQIKRNKIEPELLQIEVTENTLLKDNEIVQTTLTNLRDLGIKIALDDFGTGYSTFHYLSNFNVDTLKVDRSFIEKLDFSNEKNEKILLSMLFLAKELDLEIVAEGVEEEDQLSFLKQKNFDLVQGHIYSEAVQADAFLKMLRRGYVNPKVKSTKRENKMKRKYYRFEFTHYLLGEMEVVGINDKKVNAGVADVLVENLSIGGLKFISPLRLPVYSSIKFQFSFQLMGEFYDLTGMIVNMNEEADGIYSYGVAFDISESEKDRIAQAINKMTVLRKGNKTIPKTNFIKDSPGMFFKEELVTTK